MTDPSTYGRMVTHGPPAGAAYVGEAGPEPVWLSPMAVACGWMSPKLAALATRTAAWQAFRITTPFDRGPDDPPLAAAIRV